MRVPSFTQPELDFPRTSADDPRVVHFLGRKARDASRPRVVLIGFPGDRGVKINRGRPGAAEGPDAIRRSFYKLTPDPENYEKFSELLCYTRDLGNLKLCGDVPQDQEMLAEVVSSCLKQGMIPIVLGGGQEASYGHFLGYVGADKTVKILSWDAHADVRDLIDGQGHSGSCFRQAISHPSRSCIAYEVAGLLPHAVARKHLEYIEKEGGSYHWRDSLTRDKIAALYSGRAPNIMASFDIDCVDQVYAPGVSAPSAGGISSELWLEAAFQAGKNRTVTSFDLVELNPQFDIDGRTARLAALTIWHFLRGLSERD